MGLRSGLGYLGWYFTEGLTMINQCPCLWNARWLAVPLKDRHCDPRRPQCTCPEYNRCIGCAGSLRRVCLAGGLFIIPAAAVYLIDRITIY